jgi:hypothetical protein
LNLTHRTARDDPTPLTTGETYEVTVELEAMSWTFEAGHRVRLDLSGTDWPNAWAPPEPCRLELDRATASLELPVLDGASPAASTPILPPPTPEHANASPKEQPKDDPERGWVKWSVEHRQLSHETVAVAGSFGDYEADPDGEAPSFLELYDGTVRVSTDDPALAASDSEARFELRFPEAMCEAHAMMHVESDRHEYRVTIDLTTREDGEERWHRRWERTFPRDLA